MKKLQFIFVLAFLAIGAQAQQLTEQEAKDRALQYLGASPGPSKGRGERSFKAEGRKMTSAKVGAQKIYAFNREGGGYVIASGDSRTLPVLGYSDSGSIDWERLPENMQAWLMQYDEAIATLGDRTDFKDGISLRRHVKTRAPKAAIEPLIKTTWHQKAPYWNKTPLYEGAGDEQQGKRCITGCVATAMAQVMNYYQWPKSSPEIPAYYSGSNVDGVEKYWHIDALPPVTFDWDNMIDAYGEYENGKKDPIRILGTEAQQEAVTTLMRYCGQATYMDYSPEGSATYPVYITEALVKYFGYDDGAHTVDRFQYGIDEWEDLIYGELEGGHPVMYGGSSGTDGHQFVCDGYDGSGLFHINWGWGGRDDGYFALSVLNPYDFVKEKRLGFHVNQEVAINVRPAPEGYQYQRILPQVCLFSENPLGVFAADSVYFEYLYQCSYSDKEVIVDYAFGTCTDDGTLTPLFTGDPADSLVNNSLITGFPNIHFVKIDSTAFEPGDKLTLYPMLRFRSEPGAEWQMPGAKDLCIYAGRTDDGQFFLYSCIDLYDLEFVKTEFRNGGESGEVSELVLTIRNNGETDVTPIIYLYPDYYGNVSPDEITADTPYTEGDLIYSQAYMRPGEEAEVPFRIIPKEPGTILLQFMLGDDTPLGETYVETATGINGVLNAALEDCYFDLQGRKVISHHSPLTTPLKKGIYIRKGKKYIK